MATGEIKRTGITALLALLLGGAAGLCTAQPSWITVGDDALRALRTVSPASQPMSSAEVPVSVPERRGSRTLVQGRDRVHVVEVDEQTLPWLSMAVHAQLHRCGGFVRHDSMAEALAVLHRLQTPTPVAPAAPGYAIDNPDTVTPLLAQMQSSRILATMQSLSDFRNRFYTSSQGVAASNWLFGQWKQIAAGRSDVKVSQVRHAGWPQRSVSLVIPGSTNARETVVLGAHLDSIGPGAGDAMHAPGADDDASGVASLTEVIRVLLASGYRPRRTIEFIAYAAEEVGLRGSQQIASRYARQGKPVVGVLQLDMTAYQGDPTDLWIYTDYTDAAQNQFVADLAAAYLPQLTVGYDRCGYGCSDHASWTGRGFAASFPFEASDAHYNKALHTTNDVLATFGSQAEHALKFSRLALAFAVELGSDGPGVR
jgi:leucyl aminopeptidase